LFNKGTALYHLTCYKEVLESCEKILEINPQLSEAWLNKNFTLNKLTLYEEALEAYEKALEINPKYFDAKNMKELILQEIKDINL
jgi:superkiller protein 3